MNLADHVARFDGDEWNLFNYKEGVFIKQIIRTQDNFEGKFIRSEMDARIEAAREFSKQAFQELSVLFKDRFGYDLANDYSDLQKRDSKNAKRNEV